MASELSGIEPQGQAAGIGQESPLEAATKPSQHPTSDGRTTSRIVENVQRQSALVVVRWQTVLPEASTIYTRLVQRSVSAVIASIYSILVILIDPLKYLERRTEGSTGRQWTAELGETSFAFGQIWRCLSVDYGTFDLVCVACKHSTSLD